MQSRTLKYLKDLAQGVFLDIRILKCQNPKTALKRV